MTRPLLLDLFCKAGGAGMGYHRAGFDVVGVDIAPQPNYPFEFHQADAIEFLSRNDTSDFAAIHASPPCQRFSSMTKKWGRSAQHPDLIHEVRSLVWLRGKPCVIENVVGAPLLDPVTLCGSMFSLEAWVDGEYRQLRRHRLFESNVNIPQPECAHKGGTIGVYGNPGGSSRRDGIRFGGVEEWRTAMGIDWMTAKELAQAIPPAYTQHIGKVLLSTLKEQAA